VPIERITRPRPVFHNPVTIRPLSGGTLSRRVDSVTYSFHLLRRYDAGP
jgi:hypothetical protein